LLELFDVIDYFFVPLDDLGGYWFADLFNDFPDYLFVPDDRWLYGFNFCSHVFTSLLIYHQLPAWAREYLGAALYLQAVVLGQGYYDFGLLRTVGDASSVSPR
jgi:hypothetical protein